MKRRLTIGVFVAVPWAKRNDSPGWVIDGNGCHIWTGGRDGSGYGRCRPPPGGVVSVAVHRWRYEHEIGPIPEGLELDHFVCDNGAGGCCNPHHCRPVTKRENGLRSNNMGSRNAAKTHCLRGHPLSGGNLYQGRLRRGHRTCRICANAESRERKRRNRVANNPNRST